MGRESGQATVEWTALLLLIALVLVAAGHLASRADGRELGTTLAHSVTHPSHPASRQVGAPRPVRLPMAAVPRPGGGGARGLAREVLRRAGREGARRAGRGAGAVWRRAWFACLVYERMRYALRHPESRLPGYTLPSGDALRIVNSCMSPVDLLRDVPGLDPEP
jgi:Flp pilus assembly pilin Flp